MIQFLILLAIILGFFGTRAQRIEVHRGQGFDAVEAGVAIEPAKAPLRVTVAFDGSIRLEGELVTPDQLKEKLAALVKDDEDLAVVVSGGADLDADKLLPVMGLCNEAGVMELSVDIAGAQGGAIPAKPSFEEEDE